VLKNREFVGFDFLRADQTQAHHIGTHTMGTPYIRRSVFIFDDAVRPADLVVVAAEVMLRHRLLRTLLCGCAPRLDACVHRSYPRTAYVPYSSKRHRCRWVNTTSQSVDIRRLRQHLTVLAYSFLQTPAIADAARQLRLRTTSLHVQLNPARSRLTPAPAAPEPEPLHTRFRTPVTAHAARPLRRRATSLHTR
jgi:hypothetical protein